VILKNLLAYGKSLLLVYMI